MPVCDSCGLTVDDLHVRQRIRRLELATRFRPVHIQLLLIDPAPPADPKDFLYAAVENQDSAQLNAYFAELAKLAGTRRDAPPESLLTEFQRRGLFLCSAVECPIASQDELKARIRSLAATVLRRVHSSYKPKYIALISQPTTELIEPFRIAGWGDRLILENGAPFAGPADSEHHAAGTETSFGKRLGAAVLRLS